jgi:hypothetical protein
LVETVHRAKGKGNLYRITRRTIVIPEREGVLAVLASSATGCRDDTEPEEVTGHPWPVKRRLTGHPWPIEEYEVEEDAGPSSEKTTSSPPQGQKPVRTSRRRDPLWDALVSVFGAPATKSERSVYGLTAREIREAHPDSDDGWLAEQVLLRSRAGPAISIHLLRSMWGQLGARVQQDSEEDENPYAKCPACRQEWPAVEECDGCAMGGRLSDWKLRQAYDGPVICPDCRARLPAQVDCETCQGTGHTMGWLAHSRAHYARLNPR